jgi:Helix-turn-helix domain
MKPIASPAQLSEELEVADLIPLSEAATLSGLSVASLQKYAQRGRLAARKLGRDWFTTVGAVQSYLENRQVEKIPLRHRTKG